MMLSFFFSLDKCHNRQCTPFVDNMQLVFFHPWTLLRSNLEKTDNWNCGWGKIAYVYTIWTNLPSNVHAIRSPLCAIFAPTSFRVNRNYPLFFFILFILSIFDSPFPFLHFLQFLHIFPDFFNLSPLISFFCIFVIDSFLPPILKFPPLIQFAFMLRIRCICCIFFHLNCTVSFFRVFSPSFLPPFFASKIPNKSKNIS